MALCEGNPPVTGRFPSKSSDVELWCFLWSPSEQTDKQTIETRVIETPSRSLWRNVKWKKLNDTVDILGWYIGEEVFNMFMNFKKVNIFKFSMCYFKLKLVFYSSVFHGRSFCLSNYKCTFKCMERILLCKCCVGTTMVSWILNAYLCNIRPWLSVCWTCVAMVSTFD